MGAFSYAGDLTLLCPSVSSAQKMLQICEKCAQEYDVLFNASKSVLVVYNACIDNHHNVKLSLNDTVPHLGSYIGRENNKANITKTLSKLISRTNVLLSRYGFCDMEVVYNLFNSFCTSVYGSSLWRLNNVHIKEFATTWRKCLRKVLNVDVRIRSRYFPLLIGKEDILVQLKKRYAIFWTNCSLSPNPTVVFATKLSMSSTSVVADNLREIMSYMECDYNKFCKHKGSNYRINSENSGGRNKTHMTYALQCNI